jgi:hypothetical protein
MSLLLCGCDRGGNGAPPAGFESGTIVAGKPAIKEDPFAGTNVLRIQIDVSEEAYNELRRTGWGGGQSRPTVKATVREGGGVFTNVAIHLKGTAGSFQPVDGDPGLTLNFEKFALGQTFHGLHKISLNNSIQDPSYLTEKVCRELFMAAGVPVPRSGHARVWLNGRDLGIHVLVEGYNKQFLKRYFKNTQGNLYDGGFVQDLTGDLTVNSGENPKDRSGLDALIAAAGEKDRDKIMAGLEKTVDVDRFLSLMAMDVLLVDWDGYPMNRNNYRVFHDLDAHRMVFFPHGMDQMFGVVRRTPDCPILPQMHGMVARALLKTPEGRRRYLARLTEFYTNVFHVEATLRRVDELAAVVRPAVAEANPGFGQYYDSQVEMLKARIVQRDQSLRRQIASVNAAPNTEPNILAQLTGWEPAGQTDGARFQEKLKYDGTSVLYIGANRGETTASWRTFVPLQPGRYRFEGRVMPRSFHATGADAEAGVRLRTSTGVASRSLAGGSNWQRLSCPFVAPADGKEIEFVCELRGGQGEAYFDLESLQVVPER